MADIKIYGVLVNDTTEGIVTRADQVLSGIDGEGKRTQFDLNKHILNSIEEIKIEKETGLELDDIVTKDSKNAVTSAGIFDLVDGVASHMPYVGEDGYIYFWDPAIRDYVRSDRNMQGPQGEAGETGGTVHLIFDTVLMRVTSLGELVPKSPLRIRVVKQYGETGLDPYNEGCVKWWYNEIEDIENPDGWIGWTKEGKEERQDVESGTDMSEFFVSINPDHHEMITFVLYIDKEGTKEFDRQNIFIIKDPAIYKFDLTNENSMVPMADEDGNVLDAFLEPTQAILYYGNEQVPFEDITYSIESHQGVSNATIDSEGRVIVSGWNKLESNATIVITATHNGNTLKTTYSIVRVAGVTIYRLSPSVTNIKREADGTLSVSEITVNVSKIQGANVSSVVENVTSFVDEGISVRYTYNNEHDKVYTLSGPTEPILVQGESMPDIDGRVQELDIYLVRDSQELTKLDLFIDHETIPVLENGDDSYNIYLTNEASIVNCDTDGTQIGQLQNTQGIFMKGTKNLSDLCEWKYVMTPSTGITPAPTFLPNIKGYLSVAGCTISKEAEEVEISIQAVYDGEVYSKVYTIAKAKKGGLGESGYKSTVFCRTNETPRRPSSNEGTYESPVPTSPVKDSDGANITDHNGKEIYWKDSIPFDSAGIIWATSRLFTTDGKGSSEWSTPAQMSDTRSVNIEFSPFVENPGYPDVADDGDKWFDPTNDASMFNNPMVWMATQELSNGDPVMHRDRNHPLGYTSWTIHRIKGEQGDAASSQYKSMVFCRLPAGTVPVAPSNTEGSFMNPVPEEQVKDASGSYLDIYWTDGIPAGTAETYSYVVWMTSKIFWSDDTNKDDEWTTPQVMKDVPNKYDVQYSASETKPTSDPSTGSEWFDAESGEDLTTAIWMAQRWYTTDGWSAWDILRIKGERGEDGTGISIKGSFDDVSQLDEVEAKEVGDAYLIDGEIWIWDGYKWISGGQIKGEPGENGINGISYYLHIKYSDDGGLTFTENRGEKPGRWMGTAITNSEENPDGLDPEEPGDYKWAQIRGESSFRSTVFCRSNSTPSKPSGGSFEDPIPSGWSDGIPVGTEKIWSSTKLFSEFGGSDTDWTEPAQMSDTATFDVEFSYNAIDNQPDTPDDEPNAWIDPDDPTFDGTKANWMATKTTANGESSGWTVVLIRGEKGEPGERGESGSSAIVRSRGYWEDIPAGDWILSGTKHTESGKELIEEFVDIVAAIDENTGKEYVFKCIKSHTKSDSYDPITEQYTHDPVTGTDKSAHWMKATKYHFLATDLLNAKDIIAETITANKEEILGQIAGEWDGDTSNGEEIVHTRVSTENGMIRFFYRHSADEPWKLSVDIGYDFVSDSGVLTFYDQDGTTPLYNLGPKGLAATVINSPTFNDNNYYWSGLYRTAVYTGYGVFFEDESGKNFFDTTTSKGLVLDLKKSAGISRLLGSSTTREDIDFRYKLLSPGTMPVQMSLPFIVYDPVTADVLDYSGGTANYPSDSNPIISFSGNTIGYLGIKHGDLMYKDIKFSFKDGVDTSYGILTGPVRRWNCVMEPITDLYDILLSSSFHGLTIGNEFDFTVGRNFSGFKGVVVQSSQESTQGGIKVRDNQVTTGILTLMTEYGEDWYNMNPKYASITISGELGLMSGDNCRSVIQEALSIVGKTVQYLVTSANSPYSYSLEAFNSNVTNFFGVQRAFQVAIRSNYSVNAAYVAKHIIDYMFSEDFSVGFSQEEFGGYIFPEDKYFYLDSDTDTLELTEFEGGDGIYSSYLLDFSEEHFTSLTNNGIIKDGIFPQESQDRRAYLMLSSLSSDKGTTNSSSGVNKNSNTYEVVLKREELSGNDLKLVIEAKPVDYFTAFLDYRCHNMPDKDGNTVNTSNMSKNIRYGYYKGSYNDLGTP